MEIRADFWQVWLLMRDGGQWLETGMAELTVCRTLGLRLRIDLSPVVLASG